MPLGNIAGLDGVVPVYDPAAAWRIWSIHEIFTGTVGAQRYIPKVNDYVIDPANFTTYIVTALDNVTMVPVLTAITPNGMATNLSPNDILLGTGPGAPSETFRVLVDNSVVPSEVSIDARCHVYGTQIVSMALFKGSDTSASGTIISAVLDAGGNIISQYPLMELAAATPGQVNSTVKNAPTFFTLASLLDGELVTAVFYSNTGAVLSRRQLIVENTAFVRKAAIAGKYITAIGIDSPFISPTIINKVMLPLNVPISAVNLIAIITYSDGSISRLPIDGTKLKVFGLDQFVSTVVGQIIPLTLSYMLDANEQTITATANNPSGARYITLPFNIETLNSNSSYQVKLFGYPFWVNAPIGYLMHWFLFNADRNMFFDVSSLVQFSPSTGAFNPLGYGVLQRKSVSLDLSKVSGVFKPYIHTQIVDIVLASGPNSLATPWTMVNEGVGANPVYGTTLTAKLVANATNTINLAAGRPNLSTWTNDVYFNTYPIINRVIEVAPPTPTHFQVIIGNTNTEFPMTSWNQPLTLPTAVVVGSTVVIKFVAKAGISVMELSAAAMLVNA